MNKQKRLTKHYNLYKLKFPTFEQCVDFTSVAVNSMKVAMATVITLQDYDKLHALVRQPFVLTYYERIIYILFLKVKSYTILNFIRRQLPKDIDESVIVEIKNFFNEFKTRIISLPHALFQSEINQKH